MSAERWRRFYREREYDRCIYREGEAMVEYLVHFIEQTGVPETMLSVGCGPAVLELAIAERFPETTVVGVDVAEQVIADDRREAAEAGIDNAEFLVGALPELDLGRQFDLVYCVATLYFVREVEPALRALYDHVAPGGHLVADYPSEALREWVAEQDERRQSFFGLVAAGENVRTREAIAGVFAEPVEDYAPMVGAGDELEEVVYLQRATEDADTDAIEDAGTDAIEDPGTDATE